MSDLPNLDALLAPRCRTCGRPHKDERFDPTDGHPFSWESWEQISRRLAAELALANEIVRVMEESQIPMIPRAAQASLKAAEAERDKAWQSVRQEAEQTCIEIELRKAAEAARDALSESDCWASMTITKLEAERDDSLADVTKWQGFYASEMKRAEVAEAEVARLREALAYYEEPSK